MKEEIQHINKIISNSSKDRKNKIRLGIDTFHHTYVMLQESFLWPSVHTGMIRPDEKLQITEIILKYIPSFIEGCSVLPEPRPRKDSTQVHYVRSYNFNSKEYIYIFKVSSDYMGGAETNEIVIKGRQGVTPSFYTNRIYFSALLVPVSEIMKDSHGAITDFRPIQIKDAIFKVSSDDVIRDFRSTVLFDEIDFSEVNQKITNHFNVNSSWKHNNLFFPLIIDYLSLCMNIMIPFKSAVDCKAPIFSRLFENFIKQENVSTLNSDDRNFLDKYFTGWKFERILSRSGNPHWIITDHPFMDIQKNDHQD